MIFISYCKILLKCFILPLTLKMFPAKNLKSKNSFFLRQAAFRVCREKKSNSNSNSIWPYINTFKYIIKAVIIISWLVFVSKNFIES